MDPYYNPRGRRPDFYIQAGSGSFNDRLEQSAFSDIPFNQTSRFNLPLVNNSTSFYNHDIMNNRSSEINVRNIPDHMRYGTSYPSVQYMNTHANGEGDMFRDIKEPIHIERELNHEGVIGNGFTVASRSGSMDMIKNRETVEPKVTFAVDTGECNQGRKEGIHDLSSQRLTDSRPTHLTKTTSESLAEEGRIPGDVKHEYNYTSSPVKMTDFVEPDEVYEKDPEPDEVYEKDSNINDTDQSKSDEQAVNLSKPADESGTEKNTSVTDTEDVNTSIKREENSSDSDDETIVDEPITKSSKIFKCKECDKIYHCESSLKKHLNIHSRAFTCQICNKSWNSKYSLSQHEKVHSGEREGNLCNICGKTFFDSSSLNKHTKSVHVGIKSFACDQCGHCFYARKTLDEHLRVHTGERPFKCKICPKTYKRISDLNHHIRGHTGETKHTCDICGKGLRRLSELKVHMNQHKNDLKYERKSEFTCSWCSRPFRNESDLNQHVKEHLENVRKGFNKDDHDSAFIAATISSDLNNSTEDVNIITDSPRNITQNSEASYNAEIPNFDKPLKNFYQKSVARPPEDASGILNTCMPVARTNINQHSSQTVFPPRLDSYSLYPNQAEQETASEKVDSWLDNHFSSTNDRSSKTSSMDVHDGSTRVNETSKVCSNTVQDHNEIKADELTNNCLASNVNGLGSATNGRDTSIAKPNLMEEKQKNIATVIDFLAEKKAKDFSGSDVNIPENPDIKLEFSDAGDTDDYEIDNFTELEKEEKGKAAESPKKKLKKEKWVKVQNKNQSLKITLKCKQSGDKKRQRKRRPKKRQQSELKSEKINESEDIEQHSGSDTADKKDDFPSLTEKTKDGLYLCAECEKTFKTRAAFRKHKEMHSGRYNCPECKKSLSSQWSLKSHMLTHGNSDDRVRFPCNVCTKSFCDKSSLHKHIKTVHMALKPFKCDVCDHSFSERKTLEEHVRTHTGERPFLCTFCPKSFKRISELNHHIRGHTGEVKHTCDVCGRGYRRMSELLRHSTLHTQEKPYQCKCCGKAFRSFSVMREHLLRHFGQTKYVCERCGKKYWKKRHLERHLLSAKECTSCKYCLIPFENQDERELHEESHTGELKYLCTTCGKHFRGRGPLNKHARIHSQERQHVCDQCGASFIQSNHLKQHVRTHTGEKPYTCLVCAKSFAQSGTLYSHMKTHVSDAFSVPVSHGEPYYGSDDSENMDTAEHDQLEDIDPL